MPDNGGARRGLVCPDGAETHLPRRGKDARRAFSLRRGLSVGNLSPAGTLFPLGIFGFYRFQKYGAEQFPDARYLPFYYTTGGEKCHPEPTCKKLKKSKNNS